MTPRIYRTPIAAIPGAESAQPPAPGRGRGEQATPTQDRVLAAIRAGKSDVIAIAEHADRSADSARQALYALERQGVVERSGRRKAGPSHYVTIWKIKEAT